jgi:D-lactate dehydrogenase
MWEYTDKLKEHFFNPRNVGEIKDPDGVGEVGSLACGDALQLMFKLDEQGQPTQLELLLRQASRDGEDPVISDTSPCTLRMHHLLDERVKLLDITELIHDQLLERLTCERLTETVAVHVTCSARTMDLEAKLRGIAEACAEEVIVPGEFACCGWAGEKGFTHPELTASALRGLRASLPDDCVAGYSTSRTCEIGLSLHSGRYYRSIVYLVERCTRP